MAFSLALSRIYSESTLDQHPNEFILRKTMFTAVTFLVLFTVFVQVIHYTLVCNVKMYLFFVSVRVLQLSLW